MELSLTASLQVIKVDIVAILEQENKPLSFEEILEKKNLQNTSWLGYQYALRQMEESGRVGTFPDQTTRDIKYIILNP